MGRERLAQASHAQEGFGAGAHLRHGERLPCGRIGRGERNHRGISIATLPPPVKADRSASAPVATETTAPTLFGVSPGRVESGCLHAALFVHSERKGLGGGIAQPRPWLHPPASSG